MSWHDSADVEGIFVQKVIPIVVGVSLCCVGVLWIFGFIGPKRDDQVAPVSLNEDSPAARAGTGPMSHTAAESLYGPVAVKAGLWNLPSKERHAILESIFCSCCSHKEVSAANDEKKTDGCGVDNDCGSSGAVEGIEDRLERGELSEYSDCNELDPNGACSICLRCYGASHNVGRDREKRSIVILIHSRSFILHWFWYSFYPLFVISPL